MISIGFFQQLVQLSLKSNLFSCGFAMSKVFEEHVCACWQILPIQGPVRVEVFLQEKEHKNFSLTERFLAHHRIQVVEPAFANLLARPIRNELHLLVPLARPTLNHLLKQNLVFLLTPPLHSVPRKLLQLSIALITRLASHLRKLSHKAVILTYLLYL